MEKLLINNFAGLKSVELEIRPITGFIGPQASGKSIIAKLLFFFREIASRLPNAVLKGQDGPQYKATCWERFGRYFPIENTGGPNFVITYLNRGQHIRLSFAIQKAAEVPTHSLEWSSFYDSALEKFAHRKKEVLDVIGDSDNDAVGAVNRDLREEIVRDMEGALGPWAEFDQIFIPAGRSFFSQLQGTFFTQLQEGAVFDPFIVSFGSLLEQIKLNLESGGYIEMTSGELAMPDALGQTFEEILHGQFRRVEKQDFLEFADGRRVKLAQASSGQQEALPLLVLLAQSVLLPLRRGRVVYIEEPEAHLFPATQKLMTELMAQVFRAWDGKMCLVLTTHSPYILTSINNLLQAGKLYDGASIAEESRLVRIIPRPRTIIPGEVAFYALQDGKAKSIVDSESGLIDADLIDQVSNDIAIQFDRLLGEGNEKS